MDSQADWILVAGFLLAAFGIILRVVLMMRTTDSYPLHATPASGRSLLRAYKDSHPSSKLPHVMWISIAAGFALLLAGFLLEFR